MELKSLNIAIFVGGMSQNGDMIKQNKINLKLSETNPASIIICSTKL